MGLSFGLLNLIVSQAVLAWILMSAWCNWYTFAHIYCLKWELKIVVAQLKIVCKKKVKVKSSMAESLPVENLLPQNVGSIINYLQ